MAENIIIDGNALGHSFNNAQTLSVGTFETQAIFGVFKITQSIFYAYPRSNIRVLWDAAGNDSFRHKLYPEYKGNRNTNKDPEFLAKKASYEKLQRPMLQKLLSMVGVKQLAAFGFEADDLAGMFAVTNSRAGKTTKLVTGDSDWWQLVDEKTDWLDPRGEKGKAVNHTNFHEMTGYFSGREYIQGKALIGDGTDNISPAGGIGAKTAPVFIAEHRSVENFWHKCDSGLYIPKNKAEKRLWKGMSPHSKEEHEAMWDEASGKTLKKHNDEWIGNSRRLWMRNYQLMNLLDFRVPPGDSWKVWPTSYQEDNAKMLCERLCFKSILTNWDSFMRPFRERAAQATAVPLAA